MSTDRPRKSDTRDTLDMIADLPLIFMAGGEMIGASEVCGATAGWSWA